MIDTLVDRFCNPEVPGKYDESILYDAVDILLKSDKSDGATVKADVTTVGL